MNARITRGSRSLVRFTVLNWRGAPPANIAGFWESRFFGPSYALALPLGCGASRPIFRLHACGDQPTTHTAAASDRQCFGLARCDPDRAFSGSGRTRTTGAGSDQSPGASIGASGRGQYLFAKRQCIYLGLWHVCLDRCAHTLALNLYYLKTETLPDAAIPPTFITLNNNVQTGASLTLSHRLTPVVSVNATAAWWETRGFDQSAGLVTDQNLLSSGQSPALAAHQRFIGARYQQQDSTSGGIGDRNEAAIFVGLFHRL